MSEVTTPSASAAEARLLLADFAARAERRNKPRLLLVLSGLVVLAAGGWVGKAWWSSSAAADAALREQVLTAQIRAGIEAYQAELKGQEEALGKDALKPNPQVQSVIERFARESGLPSVSITVGTDGRLQGKNLLRKTYVYDFRSGAPQEADLLLKWIDRVVKEIPGTELSGLENFEPGTRTVDDKARWKGRITFTRLQRKEK